LSSDGDEPNLRPIAGGSGRRISPVSVNSSSDSLVEVESSNGFNEDFENTLVDDDVLYAGEKTATIDNDNSMKFSASSSGTSSPPDKGKGKEIISQSVLDLQEELECFICCLSFSDAANLANFMLVPYICSPCGHGACGPCSMSSYYHC
jgi:hypothetical protein